MSKINVEVPANIRPYIDLVNAKLLKRMDENRNYTLIDEMVWKWRSLSTSAIIKIHPNTVLHFDHLNGSFLSWRIQVSTMNMSISQNIELVRDVLKTIGYQPVKDEDLKNGYHGKYAILSEDDTPDTMNTYCWIIPGMKHGVWENHSLPSLG